MLIDGKAIARKIFYELRARPKPNKKMVAVVAGDDPALVHFLQLKGKFAAQLGIPFVLKEFSPESTTEELRCAVVAFSDDPDVGAVIIELPLPRHIDARVVLDAVATSKDPECLATGSSCLPPAVATVKTILEELSVGALMHKHVTLVGAGVLVGGPVARWLEGRVKSVTILRSTSTNEERMAALCAADIIVTGVGKRGLVTGVMVKPGVIVIDFGYPADTDWKSIDSAGGIVTPTPGGTGPILIAELFRNFYQLS